MVLPYLSLAVRYCCGATVQQYDIVVVLPYSNTILLWCFRIAIRCCGVWQYDIVVLFLLVLQVSMTMARLKKESERRSKALRKERAARALERGNARRAAGLDEGASSSDLSDNPRREGGEEGGKQEGEGEGEADYREGEDEEFDPQEAVLLVYVCTHAAEITKGKNVAGAYLVASDTSWKTKEELAKTALSLEDFAEAIATIQVQAAFLFLMPWIIRPRKSSVTVHKMNCKPTEIRGCRVAVIVVFSECSQ